MLIWKFLHPRATFDDLGYIPQWLNEEDPDPVWKQIDKNYRHGGGWHTSAAKEKTKIGPNLAMLYPGDPPQPALAVAYLRDETIIFYPCSFIAIFQKDGSFDLARID